MNGIAEYVAYKPGGVDDLVMSHALLVKRIAYHLIARLPPSVQVDDLIQAGMIGLMEAARHYDAARGASFETYAGIRIRGAMLDEIRRNDWAPRSVHRKARQVSEALRAVESRKGGDALESEVAEVLGVSLDEYHRILQDASTCRVVSLDEETPEGKSALDEIADVNPAPDEAFSNGEFRAALVEAIGHLPEREKLVLALYYDEELNLKEIGRVIGVSESRVCQILNQAQARLKARLHDWS